MSLSDCGKLRKRICGRSLPGNDNKTVEMMNQIIAGRKELNFIFD